jgi:hypothetical protein
MQELGIALLTLVIGLALGLAIIVAIQMNRSPAAAQQISGGPLLTGTPQFVPAIVATSAPISPSATTPAPSADPQFAARNLLGRATGSMAALNRYQVTGSLSDVNANLSYSLDAAVAPPDKASLNLRNAGAIPGPQLRAVFYGFTVYTSGDGGASWKKDSSSGTVARIALASLWSGFDPQAVTSPDAVRLIGSEQTGGIPTRHLQTDFATLTRAHSLLRTINLSGYSGSVDVWVSDRDATVQRIKADISDGKNEYKLDLTFSNFNGDIQINEPTVKP